MGSFERTEAEKYVQESHQIMEKETQRSAPPTGAP